MDKLRLIHEFQKNAKEKIRVELGEYAGRDMINMRVYYNASITGEEWKPTRKGITMSIGLLPELKRAVDDALIALRREQDEQN